MGHPQPRGVDHSIGVQQEVEVEHPGTPALAPFPSGTALDFEAAIEERARAEHRVHHDYAVEVGALRGAADGSSLPERGSGQDLTQRGEPADRADGADEIRPAVAEVRAEPDGDLQVTPRSTEG